MKLLKSLIALLVIGLNTNAQKTNLSKATHWNTTCHSFNDGSYLINYNGKINDKKWERVLAYYDANGKKNKEQKLDGDTHWDFANDIKKFPGAEAIHSIVDPEKKVCYTLYGSAKEANVSITGVDFQPKSYTVSPEPFQKKWALLKWYNNYTEGRSFYSFINSKGSPTWFMQYQTEGFAQITFDLKTGTETVKFFKTDELYNLHYKFVGRFNNKTWLVKFGEWGKGKPEYSLKFFSVSDDGELKFEGEQTFPKEEGIRLSAFNVVRTLDPNQPIYVTVTHHYGKVDDYRGYVKTIDFIRYNGEFSVVSLQTKGMELYTAIPKFTQHEIKNETNKVRFMFDDKNGNAMSYNVDFRNKTVKENGGVTTKNNMTFQGSLDIYNFMLYFEELSEKHQNVIKEVIANPKDVSYVFPRKNYTPIVIRGYNFFVGLKGEGEVSAEVIQ